MKDVEQKEARRLRETGLSIIEIARMLGVSKSSVSVWVRNVALSNAQKLALSSGRNGNRIKGSQSNMALGIARREVFREQGRQAARKGDLLHSQGCMLYWAEGGKRRNAVRFCNADPQMMVLFMRFMKEFFDLEGSGFSATIYCYDDLASADETVAFWKKLLGIENTSARVNPYPKSSLRKRKSLLKHGICHIVCHSQSVVQHIYGALEVYGGVVIDPLQ